MAKRKPDEDAGEPELAVDEVVDIDGDVVAPETHVCLEGVYVKTKEARPRVVVHDGANYEHTHDDATGVWCYRRM